jgi:type I restriction enzyme S subunit
VSSVPPGWTKAPLEALVEILDSARVPLNATERENRIEGKPAHTLFPYYGATGQVGQIDDFLFDEPLILLGEDGVPFFDRLRHKAYLVDGRCWVNNHAHVLRAITAVADRRYITGYLNICDYTGLVTGSTRLKLTQAAMRSIPVPVAPRAEQTRIADKLDALLARVNACRARLDRVPEILKRFRQSVLAAATSGELTREWRDAQGIAREWTTTTLGDIATVGTGATPSRANKAFYSDTGTPWITSASTGQPYVSAAKEYVTDAAIAAHRLKVHPAGTLLVAMYGEGKTRGQVTELQIDATINQACAAIRADTNQVTNKFLKLALEANYLTMRDLAEGGNQPNLNISKIRGLVFSLPSLEEQHEVASRVESLVDMLDGASTRAHAASRIIAQTTPAILAKAFRGELVPQDPNDEPASELLARIRQREDQPGKATPGRTGKGSPRNITKTESNMLARKDVSPDHLTTILKQRGPLEARALWAASQMGIDDFYDQLKEEEAQKLLREKRSDDGRAARLLEAVA